MSISLELIATHPSFHKKKNVNLTKIDLYGANEKFLP